MAKHKIFVNVGSKNLIQDEFVNIDITGATTKKKLLELIVSDYPKDKKSDIEGKKLDSIVFSVNINGQNKAFSLDCGKNGLDNKRLDDIFKDDEDVKRKFTKWNFSGTFDDILGIPQAEIWVFLKFAPFSSFMR